MTREELRELVSAFGARHGNGDRLYGWMYGRRVIDVRHMEDLPEELRATVRAKTVPGIAPPQRLSISADGTKKYLFPVFDRSGDGNSAGAARPSQPTHSVEAAGCDSGASHHSAAFDAAPPHPDGWVEAVYIPEEDRATLCVSTQVGCKMGCRFCATGKQGFQRHLDAGEILNQYYALPERDSVTNIVYMGMGEPLDNVEAVIRSLQLLEDHRGLWFPARRITVSTIGVAGGIQRLLAESHCRLAVSVHTPFADERRELMPIERIHPIERVLELLRSAGLSRNRAVTFEYLMLDGVNDTGRHARELARLVRGITCRVNLIPFHHVPGVDLAPTPFERIRTFQDRLIKLGVMTKIRNSRGLDIEAACGMLSTREEACAGADPAR